MSLFYKLGVDGYPIVSPIKVEDDFIEYEVGAEPKELVDAIAYQEQLEAEVQAKAEAIAYLSSTDFYFTVDKYNQLTDDKKLELETKREEARQVIRGGN